MASRSRNTGTPTQLHDREGRASEPVLRNGAGNGVLFYDSDGWNAITEHRQYVFNEWNPTAAGDLEALRSIWDTNGDGRLAA